MSIPAQDNNYIWDKIAVLNTDTVQGQHFVPIRITSAGRIKVNTTDTISFTMKPVASKDGNLPCWAFEGTDGKVYPAVANANGELLIST